MIFLVIGIIFFSCALGCLFLFRWIDKGRVEDRESDLQKMKEIGLAKKLF